jgi:diguanylate cyclase
MKITLLPDLTAMASLLGVLFFLRRRHPQEGVEMWLVGLLFIFTEALAHAVYPANGPLHVPLHVLALDCYLFGGLIFLRAAARGLIPRRQKLIYLAVYAPALTAIETLYACDVRWAGVFQAIAILGFVAGVAAPFVLMRSSRLGRAWWLVVGQVVLWAPTCFFLSQKMFRDAAYYPLFVLYLAVAIVFWISLPRRSMGRIAITASFTLWALIFLTHSWVSKHPQYTEFASQIWDWQKYLVIIGMLLVLLERQVESNAWFALHDQLTGLPNRRYFEHELDIAIERAARNQRRVAVVMIDLNGFKLVNDRCGHATGDRLLKQIAEDLGQVIREVDTLARLGGDEFIIVTADLPMDMSAGQITEMATVRVQEALERPFRNENETFKVGGSVGVAIYPDDSADTSTLRRLADQRMYQCKHGMRVLSA